MDIAIDVVFEPNDDAFRAAIAATAQPVVIAPEPRPRPILLAPPSRTRIWPLAVCAFVALAFATAAFLKSPLASHPKVAPYASAVMAKIG